MYQTLIGRLEQGIATLPNPKVEGQLEQFSLKELGVSHPILLSEKFDRDYKIKNPNSTAVFEGGTGGGTSMGGPGMQGMQSMMVGGPGSGLPGGAPAGGMPNRATAGQATGNAKGEKGEEENDEPPSYDAPRYDFVVQFVWQPKLLAERLKIKQEEMKKQAEAAAQAAPAEEPAPTNDQANQPSTAPGESRVAAKTN